MERFKSFEISGFKIDSVDLAESIIQMTVLGTPYQRFRDTNASVVFGIEEKRLSYFQYF